MAVIYAIIVVLGLPTRGKDLISFIQNILLKMTANAYFATPTPSLAAVNDALTAYVDAENSMGTKKGVTGDRAAKRKALIAVVKHLRDYVQGICELNPSNAAAIAESAGMRLKVFTARVKALLGIAQGLVSGSVVCDAKSVSPDATYYFSYTTDHTFANWTFLPEQMQSKVTVNGLTPGQTYYFRFRALTRKGMGDYSQIISFMVK